MVSRGIPVVVAKQSTKPRAAIQTPSDPKSGSTILLSKPW
jgi:hypothetical protein